MSQILQSSQNFEIIPSEDGYWALTLDGFDTPQDAMSFCDKLAEVAKIKEMIPLDVLEMMVDNELDECRDPHWQDYDVEGGHVMMKRNAKNNTVTISADEYDDLIKKSPVPKKKKTKTIPIERYNELIELSKKPTRVMIDKMGDYSLGDGPDEFPTRVSSEDDYDTMLEYLMDLMSQGLRGIRVDEDRIMIKYQGYTVINKKKEIIAVIKKSEY